MTNRAAFFQFPSFSSTEDAPHLTVVAPVYNEEDNVEPLLREIEAALEGVCPFEVIFVDDASRDGTREKLKQLVAAHPRFRALRHHGNAGQSRALRTGVLGARSALIATLDGDGQNDPADIPALLAHFTRDDAPEALAMVAGQRMKRQDSAAKKFASRIANGLRKNVLQDGADDTGCGLKVFYREAFLRLPYFDHIHRYLPALMLREGFLVEYRPVSHRPRLHGFSKYTNWKRAAVAFRDMLGVIWLRARMRAPGDVSEL